MRILGLSSPPPDASFDKPIFIELEPSKRQIIPKVERAPEALDAKRGSRTAGSTSRRGRRAFTLCWGSGRRPMARKAFSGRHWRVTC